MALLSTLVVATALSQSLLPANNRIVSDQALKAAVCADLEADRSWTSITNLTDLKRHQAEVREKVIAALGGFPERTPLKVQSLGRIDRGDYVIEKLLYESEPNHHVTAHLFLPEATAYSCLNPGLLIPCGHSTNGKASQGYQRAAVEAARHGMVALLYDPIDQGERAQCREKPEIFNCPGHNNIGSRALLLGWNTARFRIWDGMRGLDVLSERPEVDPNRLGVLGHSGGGTMTSWLMALDKRIQCAAPSGFLSTARSVLAECGPQDAEQFVFGGLTFGFNHLAHILLRAPSPVLHCASDDDFFPILGVLETADKAKEVYSRFGHALSYRLSDTLGPHHWHESTRTIAIDWMAHWLMGCDFPHTMQTYKNLQFGFSYSRVDTGLGYEPKNLADMYTNAWAATVTPTGRTLDLPNERTVYDIMQTEAERQKANRPRQLTPEAVRACAQVPRAEDVHFAVQAAAHTTDTESAVLVREDGTPLPAITQGRGDAVLFIADVPDLVGRSALADEVLALVAATCRVTVVDIRGFGENGRALHKKFYSARNPDEELARIDEAIGRILIGERAGDIIAAAKYAGRGKPVKLIAKGRAAIPAAHAYFTARNLFSGLELRNPPESWSDLLAKPATPCAFADVVYGAWKLYDWTDLVKSERTALSGAVVR